MQTVVVVINGSGTHGKDTFIEFIKAHLSQDTLVVNYSTIDKAKKAGRVFGCDPDADKSDAARNLWSDLKDAYDKYCDGTTRDAVEVIKDWSSTLTVVFDKCLIFIHCREPDAISKLYLECLKLGVSCITMLIERPGKLPPQCEKDDPEFISTYPYKYRLTAETLEELEVLAVEFLHEVL